MFNLEDCKAAIYKKDKTLLIISMHFNLPKLIACALMGFVLVLIPSCIEQDLDYVIHAKKRLLRQLEEVSRKNKRFYEFTTGRFKAIDNLMKKKDIENQGIPRKWKSFITKIEYEYDALKRELSMLQKEAKYYFKSLDNITAKILTNSIREQEEDTHQKVKKAWEKTYQKLVKNVEDTLHHMLAVSFRDYHKVLLGMNMHGKKEISLQMGKDLKTQLNRLNISIKAGIEKQGKLLSNANFNTLKTENDKQTPKTNPEKIPKD